MSSQKVGEEKAGPESQSLKRGSSFKSRKESIAENNSILKKESSYLSNTANGQSKRAPQPRALTFADDHGDILTEENFVNQLHYPQAKAGAHGPKGCCTIS